MYKLLVSLLLTAMTTQSFGQAIGKALQQVETTVGTEDIPMPGCGSHYLMTHIDAQSPGFIEKSNLVLQQVVQIASEHNTSNKKGDIITIPVVFHVVYNDDAENLPDSVVLNQLEILQQAFRHSHANTGAVRDEFKSIVGDSEMEFVMASKDPDGNATNGIVRQSSSIKHFGGVLPYDQNQVSEIQKWIDDSLFANVGRISNTEQGGSDAWDPYTYLNIWIGDLRIWEPKINNSEELLFVGLSTPPRWHKFWPDSAMPLAFLSKVNGVIMHYVAIGDNNPNDYGGTDSSLNASLKQGKIAVHEVGHYYGLRHIWGDGTDCTVDDFIDDTPLCLSSSDFDCDLSKNTCIDTSNGPDLPDMIENYMDYSSGYCAWAFTKGQIAVMREVYDKYRKELWLVSETEPISFVHLYPNPNNGQFTITTSQSESIQIAIKDLSGRQVFLNRINDHQMLNINLPKGIYFIEATTATGTSVQKMVIE